MSRVLKSLKIGVHPNNLHLTLASRWPGAFAHLPHEFVPYAEGRDTAKLIEAGIIDIGGTGSTPPVMAKAAGLNVTYAAASAPRPANGAILTARDTGPRTIDGLRGRRVALVDGSFLTYFLACTLESVGLSLLDIERLEIPPDRSQQLLIEGAVDAWVAMAPHLEQALMHGEAHVLAHCGATIPNRSLFWTIDDRALDAAFIDGFVDGLAKIASEITADPERAAAYLAGPDGTIDQKRAWTRIVNERDWRIFRIDAGILAEQDDEADTLRRHGALFAPRGPEPRPG